MGSDRKGPEFIRTQRGTALERWHFWPEDPAHRCRWPTSDLASRLRSGEEPDPSGAATRAVLDAYIDLLTYPLGVEHAVKRLRALRRAERTHNAQD